MKTHVIGWSEFCKGPVEKSPVIAWDRIRKALLKKETIIKVAGVTLVLLIGMPDVLHAASATGIDVAAEKIYKKLMNIGKWVIVIKGGIDTIQSAVQGDLQSAKKNFLGYLMVYVVLWALPWGLKQVDILFSDMGV
ncbi:hypothetical protein BK138_16000 [Paenibacillus rhizosphaerae]|uniref:Uncharacterized protein n=1 Tax=Paenibacillus rhizosphaerae TaxID=297318 RepID=A0A1R1ES82_9BACL|nr:hypothetical protein [Paenibacillus rhizosphaerae]OMF54661.1 hypothetical protein BK138_16000 [Paenibacillus rhizosphaerae]